jgi:hypothetical protein
MWATFVNAHKSKDEPQVEPQDLLTLSFDKPREAENAKTQEEIQEVLKKTKEQLGGKFKRGE